MAPYIAEIGILVVLILAITLVQKVLIVSPLYSEEQKTENKTEAESEAGSEGFVSINNVIGLDATPTQETLTKGGVVDLRQERQKLVDELGRVDIASHQYPSSTSRSNVRVGLERFIAEIDRALETEGRYLKISSLESIVRSARQTIRPS
jgi:hypothetical protein